MDQFEFGSSRLISAVNKKTHGVPWVFFNFPGSELAELKTQ
jgi:hypothetical protein